MRTFTLHTSTESVRNAEQALSALSPLMKRKGRFLRIRPEKDGEPIQLPREVFDIFIAVLRQMADGNSVALVPLNATLTTQEAADILEVSRPHFIALLESGRIPYRKVGSHRRVLLTDVVAFLHSEEQAQKRKLDELTSEAQKHGLGY